MSLRLHNIIDSQSRLSCGIVLLLAALILLVRKSDALLNAQLRAEDGTIFFLGHYDDNVSAIWQPYAGYLHLVPRLIALATDLCCGYAWVPSIYNGASLVVTLLVIATIYSPRIKLNYKPLFALAIVTVPHYTNEVFLNITNLQWILALALVLLLLKVQPDARYGSVPAQQFSDYATIVVCGLTGPFILFLLPIFLGKWYRDRGPHRRNTTCLAIIVAMVQGSLLLNQAEQALGEAATFEASTFTAVIGHKVLGMLILGKQWAYQTNLILLCCLYVGLLVFLLFYCRRDKTISILLGVHLIILLATFFKFSSFPQLLLPPALAARYFYLPNVMLTWSLLYALSYRRKPFSPALAALVFCILLSSLSSGFRSQPLVDFHWIAHSRLIGKEDTTIPINPSGWQISLKARSD